MSIEQHTSVAQPVPKLITAWLAAIGIASWSDFAAMVAAVYSLLLIGEWIWKRFGRPYSERKGWVKPKHRRSTDAK